MPSTNIDNTQMITWAAILALQGLEGGVGENGGNC